MMNLDNRSSLVLVISNHVICLPYLNNDSKYFQHIFTHNKYLAAYNLLTALNIIILINSIKRYTNVAIIISFLIK